jgi:8-amino-7-oxononanoate synthase
VPESYAKNTPHLKSTHSHPKTAPSASDLTIITKKIPLDMPNPPTQSASATHVSRIDNVGNCNTYLTFGGCNYLGLAHHPKVIAAAQAALTTFGLSTSASRQTTGNAQPHSDLESTLATFTGFEDALLVPDGYTANLAALQGLAAIGINHAVIDARAHASLKDAANLAQMTIHTYDHLNAAQAHQILATLDAPAVVLTDAVFTTDGDLAPLQELLENIGHHILLIDDCHGFTVLGDQGRGTANHFNLTHQNLMMTTTLVKGLGSAGGVVLGSPNLVAASRDHSTAYICTTPASPALAAAAKIALDLLQTQPCIHAQLLDNINSTRAMLRSHGIQTHNHPTPIFAFTLGDESEMLRIVQALLNEHIILPLMQYPNGPAPTYFRLSINASHTKAHIDQLDQALTNALKAQPA